MLDIQTSALFAKRRTRIISHSIPTLHIHTHLHSTWNKRPRRSGALKTGLTLAHARAYIVSGEQLSVVARQSRATPFFLFISRRIIRAAVRTTRAYVRLIFARARAPQDLCADAIFMPPRRRAATPKAMGSVDVCMRELRLGSDGASRARLLMCVSVWRAGGWGETMSGARWEVGEKRVKRDEGNWEYRGVVLLGRFCMERIVIFLGFAISGILRFRGNIWFWT